MPRNLSVGSFLDLRDVNIADELAEAGGSGSGASSARGSEAGDASTPRAAPSIALPKQNRKSLTHFAIGAPRARPSRALTPPRHRRQPDQARLLLARRRRGGEPQLGARGRAAALPQGTPAPDPFRNRPHPPQFETSRVEDCLAFIEAKGLHRCSTRAGGLAVVKATGGGAFRYADLFQQRLGLTFEKEDEMGCLVSGATFLLQELRDEAFTFVRGQRSYLSYLGESSELFPYLLVNIGSGVSILRVTRDGHERISGTNMGGGTFWGLCRLLTGCKSFDEMLALSARGDNANTDMLVGDIYGGVDYSKALGLSATTIASSFGKVVMDIDKELGEYRREDLALSLLRAISYNIAQIAVLNAMRHGLKRIFFGGFFIRGHAYTMDTISFAITFWSKGELSALFLRHEGFLGALGSFLRYYGDEGQPPPTTMGERKGSWVERMARGSGSSDPPDPPLSPSPAVLHLVTSLGPFPLLRNGGAYVPDTLDLVSDEAERLYWLGVLEQHVPTGVAKAVASAGATPAAAAAGAALAAALRSLLAAIRRDPHAFGRLSLSALLEVREELVRTHFGPAADAFRAEKEEENEWALAQLPGQLAELDAAPPASRLLALVEGVLAGNLFDWGAAACVQLYASGGMAEAYATARTRLLPRPWGLDGFDALQARLEAGPPHRRALLFCDNSGADIVLGMIPLARHLLQLGTDVVLVANSLPALNDVTADELATVLARAAEVDPTLAAARAAAAAAGPPGRGTAAAAPGAPRLWALANGVGSPCLDLRRVSRELCAAAEGADLVVLEGMGRAVHTNLRAQFSCDALKLAILKNERLAQAICGGGFGSAVCVFEPAPER